MSDIHWSWQFPELCKGAFSWLVSEFGFVVKVESDLHVRFERREVFVDVYREDFSREVGVNLGPVTFVPGGTAEESYSVWELARLRKDPQVDVNTEARAAGYEEAAIVLPGVARILRRHLPWFLADPPEASRVLGEQQLREAETYMRKPVRE